ncbi:serine/threonine protein kinase [Gordonia paraffinivorans]|uniref:serine/threonine protein kinase n=1 Tax=Gordonia paraffinivorans TaxID=175628 RepID=UPI0014455757|nr:serine/threonine protein kinase [Gordonia paraffinivorans]
MSFDATHGEHLAHGSVFAGYRIDRVLRRIATGTTYRATPVDHGPPASDSPASDSPAPGSRAAAPPGSGSPPPVVLTVVDAEHSADPRFRQWFSRSNESARATTHPAIARIVGHGLADGHLWVATAPVPGHDAAALVHHHPDGIDVDRAVVIVRAVGEALDAAHLRRLVHSGLVTSDIFIHTDADPGPADLRPPGVVTLGGFGLTPPPQDEDTPHPDTDVAGLGRVLVELLTGTTSVARHRVSGAVSPAFYAVLARALDPGPEHRYRTCAEFVRAAELALHLTHTDGEPPTDVMPSPSPHGALARVPDSDAHAAGSPAPRVFGTAGHPGRPAGPVAGPVWSQGGSSIPRSRKAWLVPLFVAAVVVAVCVGAVMLVGSRNAPAPWPPAVSHIADAFPRLIPASPDATGWRDATCAAVSRDGVDGISCTDPENLTYAVWHTAPPGAQQKVTAPLKGYPGDEITWRDGPASASRESVKDGWLVTNFSAPVHVPYTVITTWPDHSGREILDAWWRTAPLG